MVRKSRWSEGELDRGIVEFKLSSWKYFSDFVNQVMLHYTTYVFRGQGDAKWKLEPSLDRVLKIPTSKRRNELLEQFKYETRGRRGTNPPSIENEDEWWALGQHNGLLTPLLDWTESPFVALFFAANSAIEVKSGSYSIFALSQSSVDEINGRLVENTSKLYLKYGSPLVKIIKPQSNENSRLVSQRGLFTHGPNNIDIETWIRKNSTSEDECDLIKITIPNTSSQECLRYLNRMNINHLTLFPDLYGACEYCNKKLKIRLY